MEIQILAVGKKHEDWVQEGIKRYESRLRKPFSVSWTLLPHSRKAGEEARVEESGRILEKIKSTDAVILLDERGEIYDSFSIVDHLNRLLNGPRLVIVIGGAYGVDERVRKRARLVWSLSRLVFPHQLVRLILIEQLYRAQEIVKSSGYHHV